MPSAYNDFVKLHMLSLGNSIPAKERMVMIGKLWSSAKEVKPTVLDKTDKQDKGKAVKPKADKTDKPVKPKKAVKAKGGAFIPEQSPSKSSVITVLDALKSNKIERGGYQGFQGHYPDAINQSTLQSLIRKQ